jgi:hypothetical protein
MLSRTAIQILVVPLAASALLWPATAAADNYLTESHKMLCGVSPDPTFPPDSVICKGPFTQRLGWGAVVNSDGAFSWQQGDLNVGSPTTTMAYGQTYHRGNWTIYPDETGTRFVNDRTGHGMFVSVDNVYSF